MIRPTGKLLSFQSWQSALTSDSIHIALDTHIPLRRREYVVRVLMKVVDGLTVDDAVNVMQVGYAQHPFTYSPLLCTVTSSPVPCLLLLDAIPASSPSAASAQPGVAPATDTIIRANSGMEVMHERNDHNFPLDLASFSSAYHMHC